MCVTKCILMICARIDVVHRLASAQMRCLAAACLLFLLPVLVSPHAGAHVLQTNCSPDLLSAYEGGGCREFVFEIICDEGPQGYCWTRICEIDGVRWEGECHGYEE